MKSLLKISGKVTKFLVEKLSTSEVISKNLKVAEKHPLPSVFRVKERLTSACIKHVISKLSNT